MASQQHTVEGQLLWQRGALFVTLSALVLGGLQAMRPESPALRYYAAIYRVLMAHAAWFAVVMKRIWVKQYLRVNNMVSIENALGLGELGPITSGQQPSGDRPKKLHSAFRAVHFIMVSLALLCLTYVVLAYRAAEESGFLQ